MTKERPRPHFQKSTGLKKVSGDGKIRRDGSEARKYPGARIIGRTGEQQPWRQTDREEVETTTTLTGTCNEWMVPVFISIYLN